MTSGAFPPDPLANIGIDAMVRDCARVGGARFLDSGGDRAVCAEIDARADTMAHRLVGLGLAPGETLGISGGARISTFVAMLAGLRAGLNVALAPMCRDPAALAAYAARVDASALASQTSLGGHSPMEAVFEAGARAPRVRLVCGLGPDPFDGAADLVDGLHIGPFDVSPPGEIATCAEGGGAVYHAERTLALAAIDLARRVRLGADDAIMSTIAPSSFAGLVAGPCLALVAGATLRWLDPFGGYALIDALEADSPAHLIVPGALAGAVAEAGLLRPDLLRSLMLLDRTGAGSGALAPLGDTNGVPVFDLHAFGEQALVAEQRGDDGRPLPPAREPHIIAFGAAQVLTVRRRAGPGPLGFEGEAVSAA
jgi:hypothetical protein